MRSSEAVFQVVLAVMVTLAILLLAAIPHQTPGSASRVITLVTLAVQAVAIAVCLAGLYYDWNPFYYLDG